MRLLRSAALLLSLMPLGGCFGYRLMRPSEIKVPSYEAREVPVPAECDAAIRRAATEGTAALSEADARLVSFCQHQQLIRAQEEEAAARKLDAHARAASFGLQVAVVVVGAVVAVLAWAL